MMALNPFLHVYRWRHPLKDALKRQKYQQTDRDEANCLRVHGFQV